MLRIRFYLLIPFQLQLTLGRTNGAFNEDARR
jgi:hypothetical protein